MAWRCFSDSARSASSVCAAGIHQRGDAGLPSTVLTIYISTSLTSGRTPPKATRGHLESTTLFQVLYGLTGAMEDQGRTVKFCWRAMETSVPSMRPLMLTSSR
jgi:hypothetical protein